MLIELWRFLRGYVIIEAFGFSVERFLNMLCRRGASVWDVSRPGDCAAFRISKSGAAILADVAERTGVKYRIAKRRGFPFIMSRYRKRWTFMIGALFFVASVFMVSEFVWLVDIEGVERLSTMDVKGFMAEKGLSVGSLKRNQDERALEAELMSRFSDVAWANITLKGTMATVTLVETIPPPPSEESAPADIIAAQDSVITSIALSSGAPNVKVGDVVRKGETLVNSAVPMGGDDTAPGVRYVRAKAEIRGKRYYRISFSVPLDHKIKKYTGKTVTDYSIMIFDRNFNILSPTPGFSEYDAVTVRAQWNFGENYPLPVISRRIIYREYALENARRSEDEARELAVAAVTDTILRTFDIDADVMEKTINFVNTGDYLHCEAFLTMIENIGELRELDISLIDDPIPLDIFEEH